MTVYRLRSFIPLHMRITRYLLGHELLCAVGICELCLESGSITAASWLSIGSATRGEDIACLLPWLLCQLGANAVMTAVVRQERGCVVLGYAVAVARRE